MPATSLQILVPRIYDAATSAERWEPALSGLGEWLNAPSTSLLLHRFDLNSGAIYRDAGFHPEPRRQYNETYAPQNVWLRSSQMYAPVGRVLRGIDVVPEPELWASTFYREWLQPQDLMHRICAVLLRDGPAAILCSALRPPSAPGFRATDARRLRATLPHLRQAVEIQRHLAGLESERDLAREVIDALPTGVLFVDHAARVLSLNVRADEILRGGDGLTARGGALEAAAPAETARLHALVTAAVRTARGAGLERGGLLALPRPSGRRPLQVMVTPLRADSDLLGAERARAAVFLGDPDLAPFRNERALRRLHGLTVAEARLAAALLRAGSLAEAARLAGVTESTGRGYLKRIYAKTRTRGQTDLIRLMLMGPARLRPPA